eukprot:TRINITY_DN3803_c0_g1_i3.p1 TRINITY_DN3803_c0_g1~~TRINITY_DN3803_c0_g1_i3.p1  ORF type:complete len:327 (-),score=67.01 TRINITY_DN3803_c0_g1_i3:46-1026(-)
MNSSFCGWKEITSSTSNPPARGSHSMVIDKKSNLYVFGGNSGIWEHGPRDDLYVYSAADSKWSLLETKGVTPAPVFRHSAIYDGDDSNNRMIIFGGAEGTESGGLAHSNTLHEYNIDTNTWTKLSPSGVPPPRWFHIAVKIGRVMYMYGGIGTSQFFGDLWTYHLDENKWSELKPKGDNPLTRSHASVVVSEDQKNIYIIAGAKCFGANCLLNDVVRYNVETNTYHQVEVTGTKPIQRTGHSTVVIGDSFYLFGGCDWDGKYVNDFWRFDFATSTWTRLNPSEELPKVRNIHKAVPSGKSFFLFGGYSDLTGIGPAYYGDLWQFSL